MENNYGATLLARRPRHLFARGDELGRAGGKLRARGIWASAQSGLSDVLICGAEMLRPVFATAIST